MFDTRESIIAFISGAVAGLAAGLLLAPSQLVQTRNGLLYQASTITDEDVDFGNSNTVPLSEVSDDIPALEALREELSAGRS